MSKEIKFPAGFYWGAATSAFQVEGGITGMNWEVAAQKGKVPHIGRAADHYNRYEEDFDIAKELGHNAHRFSIEWARIEPQEGKFDEKEIEHYRDVLKALRARNIEPFVTLWHFTLPVWFTESGGFEREDAPEIFARYAAYVSSHIGDLCVHISTMNEPYVFTGQGWLRGAWPPFKRLAVMDKVSFTNPGVLHEDAPQGFVSGVRTYLTVLSTLARSHKAAYTAIKKVLPDAQVGLVKQVIAFSGNWNPLNKLIAMFANYFWTHRFLRRIRRHCDEIGLNYYHCHEYGDKKSYKKTDMGWDARPDRIYDALMILKRYRKPIFISEAGVADSDDDLRGWYITEQVKGTARALSEGVPIIGHLYWSLLDNYELALGYEKRFGLVEIDYDTLERKIRPSAYVYKKIIERGGVVE